MSENKLDSSVASFKAFIHKHPPLLEHMRKSGTPLQTYYEQWSLLGEDDPYWDPYRKESEKEKKQEDADKVDWIGRILQYAEHVEPRRIHEHVSSLNQTIGTLQEMIALFSANEKDQQAPAPQQERIHFFKD